VANSGKTEFAREPNPGTMKAALLSDRSVLRISGEPARHFLNNLVTYRDLRLRGSRLLLGWLKFVLICSIGAVSNIGIANWFYEQHAAWEVAGLAGAIISVFWNFMVSAIFVWRLR
jgi:dolichol-phosphate mannosyltransferase